jgi:hypothetical protein
MFATILICNTDYYTDDDCSTLSSTDSALISVCQVRLYDTSSQRRPVISVDFRESPIKAVAEDPDGHTVYIGTGTGDLASFDMRTGMIRTRV